MEKETRQILLYLTIVVVFLALLNAFIPSAIRTKGNETSKAEITPFKIPYIFFKSENSTIVSLKVPAVRPDSNTGSAVLLVVEAVKGTGRTLVDIDGLLFWEDTQQSIRMAKLIAGNISGKNLSEYDLIYSVKAEASSIGGPSAGAAIALATIFALNGEQPRDDVSITGTINHDGTIGPVESILEKAQASKNADINTLLVPLLQSRDITYDTNKYCHKFGASEVCTMENTPREIDIAKESGIEVVEIKNIPEALEYFKP